MGSELGSILSLEVPVIVCLGETSMDFDEIISWVPGAIVQLEKSADDELDLRVNNVPIAEGRAVKVGENFGIRISFVGDLRSKIDAISGRHARPSMGSADPPTEHIDTEAVAAIESPVADSGQVEDDSPATEESSAN